MAWSDAARKAAAEVRRLRKRSRSKAEAKASRINLFSKMRFPGRYGAGRANVPWVAPVPIMTSGRRLAARLASNVGGDGSKVNPRVRARIKWRTPGG